MVVLCPVYDQADLVPHMLQHYARIGASKFVLCVWNGRQNPLYAHLQLVTRGYPTVLRDFSGKPPGAETDVLNCVRSEYVLPDQWYCVTGPDEFACFDGASLQEVSRTAERDGYTAVHGNVKDRLTNDGTFPRVGPGDSIDRLFPVAGDVAKRLSLNPNRIPLSRGDVSVEHGHCYTRGVAWFDRAVIHHFRWTAGAFSHLLSGFDKAADATAYDRVYHALHRTDYRNDPNYAWSRAPLLNL